MPDVAEWQLRVPSPQPIHDCEIALESTAESQRTPTAESSSLAIRRCIGQK
jgi:hypothetical protein